MMKTLREERESIVALKGLAPDNKIPRGVLSAGSEEIQHSLEKFNEVKHADSLNEIRPS